MLKTDETLETIVIKRQTLPFTLVSTARCGRSCSSDGQCDREESAPSPSGATASRSRGESAASPSGSTAPDIERDQDESALTLSGAFASRSEDDLGKIAALEIKIEKGNNIKGRRTASPQGVIPPPARKGSDAIPPRLDPRWNSLRAQNKKKEERASEI